MADGPRSAKAAETVAAFRMLLNRWFPCDDQTFLQIAEAYVKYKDEMGQTPPELGELVSEAIRRGCGLR
ncbi:TipAS antibiotic-recognition domain protein [compost metagenome]